MIRDPNDKRVTRTAENSSERMYSDILAHGQRGARYVTVKQLRAKRFIVQVESLRTADLSNPEWEADVFGPYSTLSAATRAANVALTAE